MVERISKKILNILSDENDSEEQKEILLFGITRIVEDVPKYLAIIIICLILGVMKEFLVVMTVTALYKTFMGGVHLHTNIGCFIASLISILSCIYLPMLLEEYPKILIVLSIFKNTFPIKYTCYIFSIYCILVYVPADVPEIPIINKKRRKRDKIMSNIMLNLLFIVSFCVVKDSRYILTIIITILSIDIMTTRTIYKIFKSEYGYEAYIPEELLIID